MATIKTKKSAVRIKPNGLKKQSNKSSAKPPIKKKMTVARNMQVDQRLDSTENDIWVDAENYIVDGRIFEADREIVLSAAEEDEMYEFRENFKKYNNISRKLLKDAIKQEYDELKKGKKLGYFEGTIEDRIKTLMKEEQLITDADNLAVLRRH